ncbi:MAG: hypothetical protein WCZ18_05340 [Ottowia sp.]
MTDAVGCLFLESGARAGARGLAQKGWRAMERTLQQQAARDW